MTQQCDHSKESVRTIDLFVDSGGIRLAVRDYGGEGRPLIFVHGGPGPNLVSWDRFARRMVDRFRAIAYDQRGHGQSDDATDYSYAALAGDIQAISDTLGLDGHIVVGHSWGGMIALVYANLYPECAGVVAVDGFIIDKHRRFTDEDATSLEEQIRSDSVHSRIFDFVGTKAEFEGLLDWIKSERPDRANEAGDEVLWRDLKTTPDGRLRFRWTPSEFIELNRLADQEEPPSTCIYKHILCPMLLVASTNGPFRKGIERVHERYPQLRVEWLSCGHAVQHERPDDLAALIIDFANSL